MADPTGLVDNLKRIQARNQLTNMHMAEKLHVSTDMWDAVRCGKRQPGVLLLSGVLRGFPALRDAVCHYLLAYRGGRDV